MESDGASYGSGYDRYQRSFAAIGEPPYTLVHSRHAPRRSERITILNRDDSEDAQVGCKRRLLCVLDARQRKTYNCIDAFCNCSHIQMEGANHMSNVPPDSQGSPSDADAQSGSAFTGVMMAEFTCPQC